MSEGSDYDPGPWRGHDFSSARREFDTHAGRSYSTAATNTATVSDVVPKSLKTNSKTPLVLLCDVTGSMHTSPGFFYSKAPYLDIESQIGYLGSDAEICIGAIGDAYSDKYALQVQPFTKGLDLKEKIKKLILEGNGGGQRTESYELAALYFARKVEMPNAERPILIMIGDEAPKDCVNRAQAYEWAHTDISQLSTPDVFKELKSKYSVYFVQRPYSTELEGDAGDVRQMKKEYEMDSDSRAINRVWVELLGEDHVVFLPRMARILDIIFGILAKETDKVDYFRDEIKGRQTEIQWETAFKSLETVHAAHQTVDKTTEDGSKPWHSSIYRDGKSIPSKSLL